MQQSLDDDLVDRTSSEDTCIPSRHDCIHHHQSEQDEKTTRIASKFINNASFPNQVLQISVEHTNNIEQTYKNNQEANEFKIKLEQVRNEINEILKPISVSSLRDLKSTTTALTHKIYLKPNAIPVKQKERRIPNAFQKELDDMINDMIASNKIQETHTSPWASPLRLVRKKDKTMRITVDYQYLNSCTERVAYPFPFADDIFSKLSKARILTVIDLTSGYFQVLLDTNSRKYTAFMTSKGTFEFLVMPMGVTNATETFQRMMHIVLKDLIDQICQVYLDDIIVYSENIDQHFHHVKQVVNRLTQYCLKIKLSKCKVAQTKVEYLSHIISYGTIQPSPEKVKDLFKYKSPLNIKQIHSFVGLASYYRRFISPYLRATTDRSFKWDDQCQTSFDLIRKLLITNPILQFPRFDQPFIIESDASNFGVGGVLSQEFNNQMQPIAYFSKHLTATERNYSTTERELYAIVLLIEHFRQFI